ncbi:MULTISPECIES: AAA family ATPase [Flammeovirga]|uniref:AAA family ATPase n=1 Tax=Flammeovirga agarivorans TaxID=2726742 RepID=A0A7X8SNK8_9BACT|nr:MULTISPECIES: AAA family ATPase [Flammeovirga]NLR93523.1 AAA family ATPase [Flammeovirga agarivorans]
MSNIVENIKRVRSTKGISQSKMAEALGMSMSGYTKIERGDTDLSIKKIEDIAGVLGVSFEELMKKKEAKIITFANQKGGVGKSTMLTLFMTSIAKRENLKILVIDCDYQQTISTIVETAGIDDNISLLTFDLNRSNSPVLDFIKILEKEKHNYDIIAIDTAGSLQQSDFIITTLAYSDVAILPLEATTVALSSSFATISVLPDIEEKRKEEGRSFIALGIINKDSNTLESKDLKALKSFDNIKLLNTTLKQKVRYHRDLSLEHEIVKAKAKDEYNDLYNELITHLGL